MPLLFFASAFETKKADVPNMSYWNRAGVAFGNRDGSFTLRLDILPQTKFQLREEKPLVKEEAAAE
ncbi:MAG: hypothetical protein WBN01_12195 [Polyangiales bacterium]